MQGRRVFFAAAAWWFGCVSKQLSGPVSVPKIQKLRQRWDNDVVRIRDAVKDKDEASHRRALDALEALELVSGLLARTDELDARDVTVAFDLFLTRYQRLEVALRAAHLIDPDDKLEHGIGSGIVFTVWPTEEVRNNVAAHIENALTERK